MTLMATARRPKPAGPPPPMRFTSAPKGVKIRAMVHVPTIALSGGLAATAVTAAYEGLLLGVVSAVLLLVSVTLQRHHEPNE